MTATKPKTTPAKPGKKTDYTLIVEAQRQQIRELIEAQTLLKKRNSDLALQVMQYQSISSSNENQKLAAAANFEAMRVTALSLAVALLVSLVVLAWNVLA